LLLQDSVYSATIHTTFRVRTSVKFAQTTLDRNNSDTKSEESYYPTAWPMMVHAGCSASVRAHTPMRVSPTRDIPPCCHYGHLALFLPEEERGGRWGGSTKCVEATYAC